MSSEGLLSPNCGSSTTTWPSDNLILCTPWGDEPEGRRKGSRTTQQSACPQHAPIHLLTRKPPSRRISWPAPSRTWWRTPGPPGRIKLWHYLAKRDWAGLWWEGPWFRRRQIPQAPPTPPTPPTPQIPSRQTPQAPQPTCRSDLLACQNLAS